MTLEVDAVTPDRWPDLVELFERAGFAPYREANKRTVVRLGR